MNENVAVRLFTPLIPTLTEWALSASEGRWYRRIDMHGSGQHLYRFANI
jgi:hypothetical protein